MLWRGVAKPSRAFDVANCVVLRVLETFWRGVAIVADGDYEFPALTN